MARDRFQDLAPGLREVLSVAASHGRTFIAALVCDVCEQLRADGWAALDGVQADGALSEARAVHHYIAPASAMTAQFIDDAKFIAAKEHLQDSARALETVRTTTLLVLSQWFQQGQFDQLSWQETQRLFDVAEWVLDAPGGAERDAHESVRASLAVRLLTLQDILGVPALDAARSAVKHASGVLELDRAAFRASLPLRWQARWLLRRATDHTLRVTADSATFLELIDAATSTLRTSVEALSKDSTWQGAEAVSNAATAMVSMTWAAISQAGINGNTEFDETELLDETKLLDAAAHCLESGISSLLGLGSVEVAARCAMLDGLAEAALAVRVVTTEIRPGTALSPIYWRWYKPTIGAKPVRASSSRARLKRRFLPGHTGSVHATRIESHKRCARQQRVSPLRRWAIFNSRFARWRFFASVARRSIPLKKTLRPRKIATSS
jgi:hypothetical protein